MELLIQGAMAAAVNRVEIKKKNALALLDWSDLTYRLIYYIYIIYYKIFSNSQFRHFAEN